MNQNKELLSVASILKKIESVLKKQLIALYLFIPSLLNTAFIRQRASRKEGEAPPDTEDVSDDDMHDDDATATKNREKQMDDLDYRGEEEEREEVGEDEEEEEDESDSDAGTGESQYCITWTNVDPDPVHHVVSPGLLELMSDQDCVFAVGMLLVVFCHCYFKSITIYPVYPMMCSQCLTTYLHGILMHWEGRFLSPKYGWTSCCFVIRAPGLGMSCVCMFQCAQNKTDLQ